ncbi:Alpha/beta hydrolase family protein [Phycisphaerae bacterium RAS1]|nr:Alpha/beta hydrolase family protein [Phycisphaerae bacterium RAS1]
MFEVDAAPLLAATVVDFLARNWAVVAIASTVITLIFVPALIISKYVRISLNIMRTTRPPLTRNPLDYDRLLGEPVRFPAYDGLPLAGMLVRAAPNAPARGLIVFAHEFCSDLYSCARYCRPLLDAGYDIFAFDFRGHGHSECGPDYVPRQWVTNHDVNDMRGAVAYALNWLEENGRTPEIGVVGVSRGACAAIVTAQETPQIRAIVADGAFSTDTTIEYFMKRWAYIFAKVRVVYENHHPAFWRFLRWCMMRVARREFRCRFPSVRKSLKRMTPRAMLFIHGEKDSYLPVEQTRRLYAISGQPKYLWIAPAARHNQAAVLHAAYYADLTVGFFDRHLCGVCGATIPRTPPAPAAPLAAVVATAPA